MSEEDKKNMINENGESVETGVTRAIVDGIENRNVENTMEEYFLKYSMSVIVDRALPDVRDGLKP
ncbi:hypothetical protein IIZ77_01765, partial [Candidatus Saccharibacteria bacterium]|nr:hypothetical protein [Candidatus Saccharibacteria bacterium]